MPAKMNLAAMAVAAMVLILGGNCLAASPGEPAAIKIEQPPMTDYMRSRVGTPDELSPLVPAEAINVRKVGNQWTCDLHGQPMVFNEAASRWEPRLQEGQKK